jgi:hypothetical protein
MFFRASIGLRCQNGRQAPGVESAWMTNTCVSVTGVTNVTGEPGVACRSGPRAGAATRLGSPKLQ